jgi:hypothetical protein
MSVREALRASAFWAAGRFDRQVPAFVYRRLSRRMQQMLAMQEDVRLMRRETDPEVRQGLVPPPGEVVELNVVWVMEAYGPSEIAGLYERLESSPLASQSAAEEISLSERLAEARGSAFRQSFTPLPLLVPPGSGSVFPALVETELPEGVETARGYFLSLEPSLSVVVVGFLLTEEAGLSVDRALRAEHESRIVGEWGGYAAVGPDMVQREAVRRARAERRTACERWIARGDLAGVFASDALNGPHPTGELITTRLTTPFGPDPSTGSGIGSWWWALDFDAAPFEIWVSENQPAMRLIAGSDRGSDPRTLRFGALIGDLAAMGNTQPGGGRALGAAFQRLNNRLHGFVALWGIGQLLDAYYAELSRIRDLPIRRSLRVGRTLDQIANVQQQSRTASDALAICRDLDAGRFGPRWVNRWDGSDFERAQNDRQAKEEPEDEKEEEHEDEGETKESLIAGEGERLKMRTAPLRDAADHVRDVLATNSNLSAAASGLRVQWVILALTAVVLAATIAGIVLGVTGNLGGIQTVTRTVTTGLR